MSNKPKVHTCYDNKGNHIYYVRAEAIRPNELLYDRKGEPVAIKSKGKLIEIIGGEE